MSERLTRLTREELASWLDRPAPPARPAELEPWCTCDGGKVLAKASDFGFVMVACARCKGGEAMP